MAFDNNAVFDRRFLCEGTRLPPGYFDRWLYANDEKSFVEHQQKGRGPSCRAVNKTDITKEKDTGSHTYAPARARTFGRECKIYGLRGNNEEDTETKGETRGQE